MAQAAVDQVRKKLKTMRLKLDNVSEVSDEALCEIEQDMSDLSAWTRQEEEVRDKKCLFSRILLILLVDGLRIGIRFR
jgi:hypothetical protein